MRLFPMFAAGLISVSLISAFAIATVGTAASQTLEPAEFALVAPGTIIEGRRGDGTETRSRVGEGGDLTYTYTDLIGDRGERTRIPFCMGCTPKTHPIELERYRDLWPLEVGKSVKFQRRSIEDGWVWIHKIKVVGIETVNTELGPIDTFVVEQKVRGTRGSRWRGTSKVWFAPSLKWGVKSEWWDRDDGPGSWELISITPPG